MPGTDVVTAGVGVPCLTVPMMLPMHLSWGKAKRVVTARIGAQKWVMLIADDGVDSIVRQGVTV